MDAACYKLLYPTAFYKAFSNVANNSTLTCRGSAGRAVRWRLRGEARHQFVSRRRPSIQRSIRQTFFFVYFDSDIMIESMKNEQTNTWEYLTVDCLWSHADVADVVSKFQRSIRNVKIKQSDWMSRVSAGFLTQNLKPRITWKFRRAFYTYFRRSFILKIA